MKLFFALVVSLYSTFALAGAATSSTIEITLPEKNLNLSLEQLKAKLPVVTVSIDDPIYKTQKTYDAFLLKDIFKLAGLAEDARKNEIVFTAADGYAPNTSFTSIDAHNAYLAFREHGKKGFSTLVQGKEKLNPGPFYVVWEEGAKLAELVPWPYQLVKIEVVDFEKKYEKLYPKGQESDSPAMKGFLTFKSQCIRCHSINLQGGDLGPELNVPKNVTEYWDKDTLKSFIHNAGSFRAKDKMPSFSFLKNEEVDEIFAYLLLMRENKIKNP